MDTWDQFLLEQNNKNSIKAIIENNGLIMFFKKDKEYFGMSEDGRIIFAKMKNPDDNLPDGWEKEANFTAYNLNKMIKGETSQHVFDHKDIEKIEVVDQEEVVEKLSEESTDAGKKIDKIKIIPCDQEKKKDRDEAPNFTRTDEE